MTESFAEIAANRATWARGEWTTAKHPSDTVRCHMLQWGNPATELGEILITDWRGDMMRPYRVMALLPGVTTCSPGDTPKTVPESEHWAATKAEANEWFDLFVSRAHADGWKDYTS